LNISGKPQNNFFLTALTHVVSPNINQCELSYLKRNPIDLQKAIRQHNNYCMVLKEAGLNVIELSVNEEYPDATFVEDTAVVVDEIAVMAYMGAGSRKGEVLGIEQELAKYRTIAHIRPPGTLEGGDVLQVGKKVFVGLSARTNQDGINSLQHFLEPFGYEVVAVKMKDCLHFKSACTALDESSLLVNPSWVDLQPFENYRLIYVAAEEPDAANVLRLPDFVLMHEGFIETIKIVREAGFAIKTIYISELQKAEAAMTCSSIVFRN
jgi:dimethylargininase